MTDPALQLTTPHLINLDVDPKEREPYNFPYLHTWTLAHTGKLIAEYQRSLSREPLIPAGAPLDYVSAHMLFNLAAMRGCEEAKQHRRELSMEMDRDSIADAQKAAREFLQRA